MATYATEIECLGSQRAPPLCIDGLVSLDAAADPVKRFQSKTQSLAYIALSDDGQFACTGSPDSLSRGRLWHCERNQPTAVVYLGCFGPMLGSTASLALSACKKERFLAAFVTTEGSLYVWTVNTTQLLCSTPTNNAIKEPQHEKTLSPNSVRLFRALPSQKSPIGPLSAAEFLQDNETLICVSQRPSEPVVFFHPRFGKTFLKIESPERYLARNALLTHAGAGARVMEWGSQFLRVERQRVQQPALGHRSASRWEQSSSASNGAPVALTETNAVPGNEPSKTRRGVWVALGSRSGPIGVLFVSDELLSQTKTQERSPEEAMALDQLFFCVHQFEETGLRIKALAFYPRHASDTRALPILSLLSVDGFIRHWSVEKDRMQTAKACMGDDTPMIPEFLHYGPLPRQDVLLGVSKNSTATKIPKHARETNDQGLSHHLRPVSIVATNLEIAPHILNGLHSVAQNPGADISEEGPFHSTTPLSQVAFWTHADNIIQETLQGYGPKRSHTFYVSSSQITGLEGTKDRERLALVTLNGTITFFNLKARRKIFPTPVPVGAH